MIQKTRTIDGKPYAEVVEIARTFIKERGGFEKFAEWGLYKKAVPING